MLQIYDARLALVYSLAHLGDPQAQAEQARMSGQATHRKWILRFHAQIAPKRLDALTSGLADRSVEVREFTTRLVLEHPDENLLPALAPLLADGNEMVRDRAAEGLRACASHNEELLASVLGQLRRTDKMAAEAYTAPPTSTRVLVLHSLRYANSSPGVLRHLLELLDGSDKAVLPHLPCVGQSPYQGGPTARARSQTANA